MVCFSPRAPSIKRCIAALLYRACPFFHNYYCCTRIILFAAAGGKKKTKTKRIATSSVELQWAFFMCVRSWGFNRSFIVEINQECRFYALYRGLHHHGLNPRYFVAGHVDFGYFLDAKVKGNVLLGGFFVFVILRIFRDRGRKLRFNFMLLRTHLEDIPCKISAP